ncbi:MAG TPA: ABC transporter permease [Candidatus Eisenbacteria bacterium]|jgi:putative ABC transport system permease protein|nr:ABC transporter permease [Candidatus Eisenbacteria bacterium]
MNALLNDIRYALRLLAKSPGFTIVAVLTLALGIGANTAMFSVIHAVLLRPLPFADSDRLISVWNDYGSGGQSLPAVSPPDFRDYQQRCRLFDQIAGATGGGGAAVDFGTVEGDERPQQVTVGFVSDNLFPLFGVQPILGRNFLPQETVLNGPNVVILSYGFWQRRFGGDPSIVGKTLRYNRQDVTVVGVLPRDFHLLLPPETLLLRDSELWRPAQIPYDNFPRNLTTMAVFGKLKQGVTLAQAQSEMDGIAAQLRSEHEVHRTSGLRIRVVPLQFDIVKDARTSLLILLGAVTLVLLIACANVANLLLARAIAREREVAMRAALGAGRGRLVRQVLTEALVLAMLGGLAGIFVGSTALELLLRLNPGNLPRLVEVHLDGTVLAFSFAACAVTGVLFGILPALQLGKPSLSDILKEGGKATGGMGRSNVRRLLVISEIAVSLMLLLGAGLLIRSFFRLESARPGYETSNILTMRLNIPGNRYQKFEDVIEFTRKLQIAVREIPGVESMGIINRLPLSGSGPQTPYAYDAATEQAWESISADWRWVTPGYFETMGMQLAHGRFFNEQDDMKHPYVTVIDEMLANRAWPGQNPIGKRLQLIYFANFNAPGLNRAYAEVIGVLKHPRVHDLTRDVREQVYISQYQQPNTGLSLVVRTKSDPNTTSKDIEQAIRNLDRGIPVFEVKTMGSAVSDALASRRFSLFLLMIFGGLATGLAVVGLYGTIAFSVSQRTQEIGIRMAMGATTFEVSRMVLREALHLVGTGILAGLIGTLLLGRILNSLLFEVSSIDPVTYLAGAIVIAGVSLLACWMPARRATRVDPIVALRYE